MKYKLLGFNLVLSNFGSDLSMLDNVHAIRQRRRKMEILFDQNNREPLAFQVADHLSKLLHDHWCKSFRNLVE